MLDSYLGKGRIIPGSSSDLEIKKVEFSKTSIKKPGNAGQKGLLCLFPF